MSYNSKYSGEQVENLLDQVASGNTGGGGGVIPDMSQYITEDELDTALQGKQDSINDLETIRTNASKGATALQSVPSEYVTETELTNKGYATTAALNNKVDKVDGKQLSTEDFTSILKSKLEGLTNYDDTQLESAISTLRNDFDKLVSGDTTTAIKTFNEVIAFLDGIQDTNDLSSIIASIEQQIAAKGTYSKPSLGIPKTDLASAVQTSLGKADTALQSYTEQYKGTVTKVKINGSEKTPDANGLVDLGTIEGGSSSSDGIVMKVETIIPSSGTITFIDNDYHTAMKANTIYIQGGNPNNDVLESLYIENFEETDDAYAEYVIIFTFNSFPFFGDLSLPEYVKWANGEIPNIEENVIYELNIARSAVAGEISYCAVLTPFKSV